MRLTVVTVHGVLLLCTSGSCSCLSQPHLGHRPKFSLTWRLVWWKAQVCWHAFCTWDNQNRDKACTHRSGKQQVMLSSLSILQITSQFLIQNRGRPGFPPPSSSVLDFLGGMGLDGCVSLFCFFYKWKNRAGIVWGSEVQVSRVHLT